MKSIALAAALMISGPAIAQETVAPPTTGDQTVTPPDSAPSPATDAAAPVADAAPPAAGGDYPRCSRTVTDHCRQSSARESDTKGGAPAHRRSHRHR